MSPEEIDRTACPLNSSIPHPRVIFHNMNSLSNYPNHPREHARNKRVLRHITSLNNTSDITCLQETHTASGETRALSTQFGQTHLIFYNNLEK